MLRKLMISAGLALALSTPAFAADATHAAMAGMSHATIAGEGAGEVKSVDAAKRSVTIAHGPIASLQWPGMTMPFAVAKDVDLSLAKPGAKVTFTVEKQADGSFAIVKLAAAK